MNKAVIFGLGAIIGGTIGSVATYIILNDKYTKEAAEAVKEIKDDMTNELHNGAVITSEEDLREYYIEQLRDLGFKVIEESYYEDDGYYEQVNPVDDEEEEEDEAPIEPNPNPYILSPKEALTSTEDYDIVTIHFYKGDKVFTDTNYDIIDDYSTNLGKCVSDIYNAPSDDGVYVCNEVQSKVYEVLIYDDSYKHAVEGIDDSVDGDMAD